MITKNSIRFALIWVSLGLIQCERTVVFNPKFPDKTSYQVYHLGTYSVKLDEDKEIPGTIFQTTNSFDLNKANSGWTLHRKIDTLGANGFHKLSMPHELEKKVSLTLTMDENFIPIRVDGYDSLKSVLSRIQQKEEFRAQLLASSDTAKYQAEWRDWWRLDQFLPKGVKIEAFQHLPVDEINKTLEMVKLDSARFDGPRPRSKKNCLEYTLYYHRQDSLPLLKEQFFNSPKKNMKYRKYTWVGDYIAGVLQYSVERSTGMPCFQSKTETASLKLEFKEEKVSLPVYLYRYEEDLFYY